MSYFYQPDYTKTGKEMLVNLINFSNQDSLYRPFTVDNIWFSEPKALAFDEDCNTEIRITDAVGYQGFEYPISITYNRLDIYQLALQLNYHFKVFVNFDEIKSTKDLLTPLFDQFKVKLTEEDIIDEKIEINKEDILEAFNKKETYQLPVTLKMSPKSVAYLGQLDLVLEPIPIRVDTAVRRYHYPWSFMQVQRNGLS